VAFRLKKFGDPSFRLIISAPFPVAGFRRVRLWVAYLPWILVTLANMIIDVAATIIFANHVSETQVSSILMNEFGL
jgi:hypothetical protein